MAHRPRRDQHAIGSAGGFGGEIAHSVQIAAVGNAEFHIEPDEGARIGPVDHLIADQVFVRDQVLLAVAAAYRRVARPKVGDRAVCAADLDYVAGLYRAFEQQDDAADKIRHNLLEAEPKADADGPAEDGECGQVNADRVEADQQRHGDQGDSYEVGGQDLNRRAQRGETLEPGADDPR